MSIFHETQNNATVIHAARRPAGGSASRTALAHGLQKFGFDTVDFLLRRFEIRHQDRVGDSMQGVLDAARPHIGAQIIEPLLDRFGVKSSQGTEQRGQAVLEDVQVAVSPLADG